MSGGSESENEFENSTIQVETNIENWSKICRLCLNQKSEKRLARLWVKRDGILVSELVNNVAKIQIEDDDLLPSHVCESCVNFLLKIKKRLQIYKKNDKQLKDILKDKGSIELDEPVEVKLDITNPLEISNNLNETGIEHIEIKLEVDEEESTALRHDEEIKEEKPDSETLKEVFKQSEEESEDEILAPKKRRTRVKKVETKALISETKRKRTIPKVVPVESDYSDYDPDHPDEDEEDEDDDYDNEGCTDRPERTKRKNKPRIPRAPGEKYKRPRQYPNAPVKNDNKCYVCLTQLEDSSAYFKHLFTHIDMIPYKCDKCVVDKVTIDNVKTLEHHFKMHARPVKCDYCDTRFNSDASKTNHINYAHLNQKSSTKCETCGEVFESELRCETHKNKVHLMKFPCPQCNKPLGSKKLLNEHIKRKHTNEFEVIACVLCPRKLKGRVSFNRHMRGVHNKDVKAFLCNLCGQSFMFQSLLANHLDNHAEKPDGKMIKHRKYIDYYNQKIDESGKTMMECKTCQELVARDYAKMRLHMGMHIKAYKCTICFKGFRSDVLRMSHENTHTGAKPFSCEICGMNFISRATLKVHTQIKHKEVMPLHCGVCGKPYETQINKNKHEEKCRQKAGMDQ